MLAPVSLNAMTPHPPIDRYHRQALLPGIGPAGQDRLNRGHAVIVGCGALGCVSADWLARAGVGTITLIDRDLVEPTNLQRQTLYDEADAGLTRATRAHTHIDDEDDEDQVEPGHEDRLEGPAPKALAAARRLRAVNSSLTIRPIVGDLQPRNGERALGLLPGGQRPDVILDGTDNYSTRYLLNDLAVKHAVPMVYAGVIATRGMIMPIIPGRTACLRCVFEDRPAPGEGETCDTVGVLGPVVGIAASAQACEALKILAGAFDSLRPTLLSFDAWANTRATLRIDRPRPGCPCCDRRHFEFLDGASASSATALCGQNAVQVWPAGGIGAGGGEIAIDLRALAQRLAPFGTFSATSLVARGRFAEGPASSKPYELTIFADGRAIIRGTRDPAEARSVYARWIGS
jgi:molybdopterin-synthase adenylyltransferase